MRFFFYLIIISKWIAIMCYLSNAEVFNRWRHCKKQTAKDYWHDFLLVRARYGDKDAKRYTNFIKQTLNTR